MLTQKELVNAKIKSEVFAKNFQLFLCIPIYLVKKRFRDETLCRFNIIEHAFTTYKTLTCAQVIAYLVFKGIQCPKRSE